MIVLDVVYATMIVIVPPQNESRVRSRVAVKARLQSLAVAQVGSKFDLD